MLSFKLFFLSALLISFKPNCFAQQRMVDDTTSIPPISQPAYPNSAGSIVCIDAAHNNLHSIFQGYLAFAKFLEKDGYKVEPNTELFIDGIAKECEIIVIANALNIVNTNNNWQLPTPSAFTETEVQNISEWVKKGGKLFLIADHMPFPGAAKE